MANEIGLTWEELHAITMQARSDSINNDELHGGDYDKESERLWQVLLYCEGKSGPINIVDETVGHFQLVDREELSKNYPDKIDQDEALRCEHPVYLNFERTNCGKLATHYKCSPIYGVSRRPLCPEHAKLYEGAEEL